MGIATKSKFTQQLNLAECASAAHSTLTARAQRAFVALAFPLALTACSTQSADEPALQAPAVEFGELQEALSNCGYTLKSTLTKQTKKGFKVRLKISNGGKLMSTGFKVLVKAPGAQLTKVGHGTFETVENGYLLSTLERAEAGCDFDADDDAAPDPEVLAGRAYRFHLTFQGSYSELSSLLISSSGLNCDLQAPTLTLSTNRDLFTSNDTLTLSAQASDDVGVSKVVFAQDGVELGSDKTAPFALSLPLSGAQNGRHVYTATAFDATGNQSAQSKRVLVAIGNKFFGTATTSAADYAGLLPHFNQITPGNAGKWGSVEATRDQLNWTELDTAYNFAKSNQLPFKLHTLIWGQQQPAWLDALTPAEQRAEIEQWLSALAARYPNIDLIDVVNEPLHAPPSYTAALGGAGSTGWDWVVTAFELARQYFPHAELLLNDYAILSFGSATQSYLQIVNLLKDRGLIDGVGEQGHFYERAPDLATLNSNLDALAASGLPLYISELDVNFSNDAQQAQRMRDLFSLFWSKPSVLGITHWGYLQGNMWQTNAYLVRTDGSSRPAFDWIECYRAGGSNCSVPTYVPPARSGDSSGLKLEAEEYDSAQGLQPAGNVVAYASDGAWFGYDSVVFDAHWDTLKVTYANGGNNAVNLTLHLGNPNNPAVANVVLAPTGGWGTAQTVSVPWAALGTPNGLYARFVGGGANVDQLAFSGPAPATTNLVANGSFESGTNGWYTWSGGTLTATNTRAHSGTQSLWVSNRASNAPAATNLASVVQTGKSYPFSVWVALQTADGSAQSVNVTQATQCQAADGTLSTSYAWIAGPTSIPGAAGSAWVQLNGTLAVPNCTLTSLQIYVEGAAGADLYIDDVQVLDSSAGPSNLLSDGAFETGQGSWFGWGNSGLAVTSTISHGGTQSLLGSAMQFGAIARDIKTLVAPGKRYQATAWVSVGNLAAGSGAVKFQTVQNCNASGDSYPWLAGATVNNGQWQTLTGVVDLSACNSVDNLLLFVGADSGDLYVDDVTLVQLP